VRKNALIMILVAFLAATGGYFFAMAVNPVQPPDPTPADFEPGPTGNELVGARRPDFTLHDVRGNPVSADDFDGHIWLANFWATWCAPCVEEMPMLSRLQQEYAGDGLIVVGIALDDASRASEFAADLGVDYPILVGKTDVVLAGRQFGNATGMLPFSVLIDAGGIIRWTHLGALSREQLQAEIRSLR
jgi:thiol-disulfide isomerase/thioredoxin